MNKYTYKEYSNGNLICEIQATDISQADKEYKKITGNDVEKQSYVGCIVEKL